MSSGNNDNRTPKVEMRTNGGGKDLLFASRQPDDLSNLALYLCNCIVESYLYWHHLQREMFIVSTLVRLVQFPYILFSNYNSHHTVNFVRSVTEVWTKSLDTDRKVKWTIHSQILIARVATRLVDFVNQFSNYKN